VRSFRASAVQLKAGRERDENLTLADALVADAAEAGAELVVLPEVFAWRGPQSAEPDQAEPIPGPTSDHVAALARRLGIHLVAGSLLETSTGGKCYNTSLLIGPDGTILARYRKIHLFEVDIEGEVTVSESRTRRPGEQVVCVDTELGRIGMSICYDLRFPELYRRLADAGAEIIVVPAAFTATTGAAHWEPLVRARAIENQCFVVTADQFGANEEGFREYGHSMIVDPWGRILAEAGGDGPRTVTALLDAQCLVDVRRKLPSLEHRRLRS
jgi:predicted amidohydrolase